MTPFTIYPAIDLRQGRVVRLVQGDPLRQTVYQDDPLEAARTWMEAGARWLHVVNLDGAFGQPDDENQAALAAIMRLVTQQPAASQPQVQFGGGLRSLDGMQRIFDLAVNRVVLGTSAILQPVLIEAALKRYGPQRIAIAIDVRRGKVSLRGWQEDSDIDPLVLSRRLSALGIDTFIYTSIVRDGTGSGSDVGFARQIKDACQVELVASGGVHSLEDIRSLRRAGIDGVIVGRALYDGLFTLQEALAC